MAKPSIGKAGKRLILRPKPLRNLDAALRNRLQAAGRGLGLAAPDVAAGQGNSYEAWVLFALALRLQGRIIVTACDHQTNVLMSGRRFKARGGPGHIRPARRLERDAPCHFLIEGQTHSLELHLDIEHVGASDATHELDVSVVETVHADVIRAKPLGGPFPFPHHIGLELKAYDEGAMLSPAFARALLGVRTDLRGEWPPFYLEVGQGSGGYRLRNAPRSERYWLLTTADLDMRLLDHHGLKGKDRVRPWNNEGVLDTIADAILAIA